eukprot:GFYU01003533.1.p1 GENE.GFYU01003533.1~~GFYU01003533.1.p1  ORF type:complete len:611 (+),score=82.29 GFYU01003533.1:207-2039(+)
MARTTTALVLLAASCLLVCCLGVSVVEVENRSAGGKQPTIQQKIAQSLLDEVAQKRDHLTDEDVERILSVTRSAGFGMKKADHPENMYDVLAALVYGPEIWNKERRQEIISANPDPMAKIRENIAEFWGRGATAADDGGNSDEENNPTILQRIMALLNPEGLPAQDHPYAKLVKSARAGSSGAGVSSSVGSSSREVGTHRITDMRAATATATATDQSDDSPSGRQELRRRLEYSLDKHNRTISSVCKYGKEYVTPGSYICKTTLGISESFEGTLVNATTQEYSCVLPRRCQIGSTIYENNFRIDTSDRCFLQTCLNATTGLGIVNATVIDNTSCNVDGRVATDVTVTESQCAGCTIREPAPCQNCTTEATVSCHCPLDFIGSTCQSERDFECKVEVLSPEANCPTQSTAKFDLGISGDPPCYRYPSSASLTFAFKLNCTFTQAEGAEHNHTTTFDYWGLRSDRSWASLWPIEDAKFRLKIFNFNRFSDNTHVQDVPLTSGDFTEAHIIAFTQKLNVGSKYAPGGRIYIEAGAMPIPNMKIGQRYIWNGNPIRRAKFLIDLTDYSEPEPPLLDQTALNVLISMIVLFVVFVVVGVLYWQKRKKDKAKEKEQ